MASKAECLATAAEIDARRSASLDAASTLAAVFGGADPLAVAAFADVEAHRREAEFWRYLARLHPSTRAAELRARATRT